MSPLNLVDLLGGTLVRGGLILAAAFLGVWLLRRRFAAGRYGVWTAAFAGLALLPALTLILPVLEPPTLGRAEQMVPGPRAAAETINRQFGENVYNIWLNHSQWGIVSQPYVNGVEAAVFPDGTPIVGLAGAGAHQTNHMWCDEGKCE